ncbi:MAG: T9SS type A sorting domain-containing protein [Bacteroidia bacterium]|jgi:hypothetical protein|nr:T9SS type A sorting domain-containing protein [Bacteroidia bacterium]
MKYLCTLLAICNLITAKAAITVPAQFIPADNSTFTTFRNSLAARTVANATGYQFQLDTISTFQSGARTQYNTIPTSPPQIQTTITVSTMQLRIGKQYFWRVRAYAPGDTSAWSSTWKFNNVQGQLNLNGPSNNTTGPIRTLNCINMSIDSAGSYLFEVDTNASFSSPLRVFRSLSSNAFQDSTLFDFNRTIYWRATCTNGLGDTLLWSPTWKYTTHALPTISGLDGVVTMVDPVASASWTNAGISSVEVQFDTLNTFNSAELITRIALPPTTIETFTNLVFGKRYYYRIRGVYAGKVSAWSNLRAIQVYNNGNFTSPSFDGQTINLIQNINFSWRQMQGTVVRFVLYADSSLSIILKDTVTNLATYRYIPTLSLNKWYQAHITYFHDADTATTLVRHFKIYDGAISLSSPTNNATNQIVRPRLTFQAPSFFTQFVLEIDSGTAFATSPSSHFQRHISFDTSFGTTLFKTINPLHYNQRYVWRVYAIRDADTGAATTRVFTTAAQPTNYFPPTNFIGLGTSSNGLVTTIDSSVLVQWELDTASDFSSPIKLSGTNPSMPDEFDPKYVLVSLSDTMLFHTKYYWRTRCINQVDTSDWSFVFNFTTTTDVQLQTPANGAVNIPIRVPLDWSIQGSNLSQRFQYQIGTDSTFATSPIITLGIDEFSEDTFNATHSTTYYWRARAFNAMDTSKWSVRYSFTTVAAPVVGSVTLSSPANNATILPGLISFSWIGAVNANAYDVQVSTNQDFSTLVASGAPTTTGVQWQNAQPRTKYYWRVRGVNAFGTGPWATRTFTTSTPVTVTEIEQAAGINLFPNPTNQYMYIEFAVPSKATVYNALGQLVWQSNHPVQKEILNTIDWPSGIYTLVVQNQTQRTTQSFVVFH